ncbi:Vps62-related protein [Pseudomonas sp. NPDC087336]|uniref:Vps62-related protein n=1 Tax=Pseudomonas sp. NPDC087336 TaxID=3364436 RepID=UPI00381CC6C0
MTNENKASVATPMESIKADNLLINFTTEFLRVCDVRGSSSKPASFWRPTSTADLLPGFFPLGDVVITGHDNINEKRVVAVVCEADLPSADPEKGKALARPDDFEQIWAITSPAGTSQCTIWQPIPPEGYAALGLVCTSDSVKPSFNSVRCVRTDLVVASDVGAGIWDSRNSGPHQDFSAWTITPPTARAGEIHFAPGTFVGANSFIKPATHPCAYSLRMKIALRINPAPVGPILSGYEVPPEHESLEATQIAYIPWFAVKDDGLSAAEKLSTSPYYRLERSDAYALVGYGHNTGKKGEFFKWRTPRLQNSKILEIFTRITSVQVGPAWSARPAEPVDSIQFSARLNKNFSHTETSTREWLTPTTVEVVAVIPANRIMAVYQLQSHFDLVRYDGTQAGINFGYADNSSFHLTEYSSESNGETEVRPPVLDLPTPTDIDP